MKVFFYIPSYDDRRELMAILSEHGYPCHMEKFPKKGYEWNKESYVVVEDAPTDVKEKHKK